MVKYYLKELRTYSLFYLEKNIIKKKIKVIFFYKFPLDSFL